MAVLGANFNIPFLGVTAAPKIEEVGAGQVRRVGQSQFGGIEGAINNIGVQYKSPDISGGSTGYNGPELAGGVVGGKFDSMQKFGFGY